MCAHVCAILCWRCYPRLIEQLGAMVFKVTERRALLEPLETPHFHNYSAFICAADRATPRQIHIVQAQRGTYTEEHAVQIFYTSTHIHLHMWMLASTHMLYPLTFNKMLFFHYFFFFLFIWSRRKLCVLRILQSPGRRIEPVINYWIQRYLWDVQMPVQIRLCQCAVMCVGGCSLSVPAPSIS